MKKCLICCSNCGHMAEKPQKEITRQHKKGNSNFFCDRSCFCQYQAKHHSANWDAVHHRHRRVYLKNNPGQKYCCFCSKKLYNKFDVHHVDGNFRNGTPENLKGAHKSCHITHHKGENYKTRKIRATGSEAAKKILGLN